MCCSSPLQHPSSSIALIFSQFFNSQEHNAKKKPIISSKDGLQGAKKARREKGAVTLGRPPGQGSAPKKLTGSSSSPSLLATQYSVDRLPLSHSESDSQGGRATDMLSDPDPLGDSIEEDDLFFSNESFDDLRAQATENGTNDASGANRFSLIFNESMPTEHALNRSD